MAKGIPDALQMREVKYGEKTQPTQQLALAKTLLEAGRVAEALDLFLLAGDEASVTAIHKRACAEGRPVWLVMIERTGRTITSADWKACGEAALRGERWREAFRAFTMAGDEAGIARAQEEIPGYEIYVPQGK
ncbi:MAG: hypothetical protein ACYTEG_11220 [Planctomycetota bacterium]|jgi:hypothetical protein